MDILKEEDSFFFSIVLRLGVVHKWFHSLWGRKESSRQYLSLRSKMAFVMSSQNTRPLHPKSLTSFMDDLWQVKIEPVNFYQDFICHQPVRHADGSDPHQAGRQFAQQLRRRHQERRRKRHVQEHPYDGSLNKRLQSSADFRWLRIKKSQCNARLKSKSRRKIYLNFYSSVVIAYWNHFEIIYFC